MHKFKLTISQEARGSNNMNCVFSVHFPQNVKLFQKIDRIFAMHACIDFVIATCFKVVADRCRGKRSLLEYCRKYGHGIVFLIGN